MARQITHFGEVIEQPASKQRRSGSHEEIKGEIFKEAWKEKASWPRLHVHVHGVV